MSFVGILIDGVTSPSGDGEHQFRDNPCMCKFHIVKAVQQFCPFAFSYIVAEPHIFYLVQFHKGYMNGLYSEPLKRLNIHTKSAQHFLPKRIFYSLHLVQQYNASWALSWVFILAFSKVGHSEKFFLEFSLNFTQFLRKFHSTFREFHSICIKISRNF